MSVKSVTPMGILRKPSIQSPGFQSTPTNRAIHGVNLGSPMAVRAVHFEPPSNLRELLARASSEKIPCAKTLEELDGHLTHLKNQRGPVLVLWLQALQENVCALKPKMENFVFGMLKIAWANQEPEVIIAYRNFLTNLVSAQGYYVKPVVRMLISNFIGFTDRQIAEEQMSSQDLKNIDMMEASIFVNTHLALQAILEVTPLASKQAIIQYAKECLPYAMTTDTRAHTKYIDNLMKLTKYLTTDRRVILRVVITRLVELDAHLPRQDEGDDDEDLFDVEFSKGTQRSHTEVARDNLDESLLVLFGYIKEIADKDVKDDLKSFYFDFIAIFETHILPVYATGHVQFLMFYLLSFRPAFVGHFLDHMWKLFSSVNTPSIIRQSTVAYIASLISRGQFIKLPVLMACLEKIVEWIHSYISHREPSLNHDVILVDVKSHGPFYAACQASFYMFAFRHEELVQRKKHLTFLRSLQFNSIVTSPLNPLRVCLPPVVKNFAAIARHYQLAYCETIIHRNSRINLPVVGNLSSTSGVVSTDLAKPVLLDSFFPFDPYRLPKSKVFVEKLYREYQGNLAAEDSSEGGGEEAMEEDMEQASPNEDPNEYLELEKIMMMDVSRRSLSEKGHMSDFVYGTSPGFLS